MPVVAEDAWSAIAKTLLKGDCARSRLPHVLCLVGVECIIASELVAQQEEWKEEREREAGGGEGRRTECAVNDAHSSECR